MGGNQAFCHKLPSFEQLLANIASNLNSSAANQIFGPSKHKPDGGAPLITDPPPTSSTTFTGDTQGVVNIVSKCQDLSS